MSAGAVNWPKIYQLAGLGDDTSLRDSAFLPMALGELEAALNLLREADFQSRTAQEPVLPAHNNQEDA